MAVTRDATNRVRFYIDGRESAYSPTTPLSAFSDGALALGADNLYGPYGEHFRGLIGELRVWNQWRSGEQIRQTYTQRPAAPQAGLVVCYDMQDASPSQSLSDRSGVAQNGQNPVPGVLGQNPNPGADDPAWVSNCALACTVQGNFRTGPLTWTAPDSTAAPASRAGKSKGKSTDKAVTAPSISPNPTATGGTTTLHFDQLRAGQVRL